MGEPVANPLAGGDDGRIPDNARRWVALGADDSHRQVAGIAGAKRLGHAGLAQGIGRKLGTPGLAQRVDRNPHHHPFPHG